MVTQLAERYRAAALPDDGVCTIVCGRQFGDVANELGNEDRSHGSNNTDQSA
jgi:hypothetical protein